MLLTEEANEEADGIAQYRARSLVLQRRNRLPERERKLVVGSCGSLRTSGVCPTGGSPLQTCALLTEGRAECVDLN